MKKYKLSDDCLCINGVDLYRIIALKNFFDVKKGDIGGFVESYKNLSQEGNCWVYGDARVSDDAVVYGNARVFSNARVYDNARVYGDAKIYGNAKVFDNAKVLDNADVYDNALVYGNSKVFGNAKVFDNDIVSGKSKVYDNDIVSGDVQVCNEIILDKTLPHKDVDTPDTNQYDYVLTMLERDYKILIERYHKAKHELIEAKKNGWKLDYSPSIVTDLSSPELKNPDPDKLLFNRSFVLCYGDDYTRWSDWKIIKEEPIPSFTITTDEGSFKPEYKGEYWKFGCAIIEPKLIESIVNASTFPQYAYIGNKGIEEVKIGKGVFTIEQLKELHQYHKKN